tara:strand:+ start:3880 stop:4185 length:306 start_codon:yes stop_codon:yes gene_type:complete
MIDTDKYEGHTEGEWEWWNDYIRDTSENELHIAKMEYDYKSADAQLIADAPLLLEFIQKIVKDWCKPNQCNQAFGKDVRQLMYEYGLIIFDEETRRYEVKE